MNLSHRIFGVQKTRELGRWSDTKGKHPTRTARLHTLACGLPFVTVVDENGLIARNFFIEGRKPQPLCGVSAGALLLEDIYDGENHEGIHPGKHVFTAARAQEERIGLRLAVGLAASEIRISLAPMCEMHDVAIATLAIEVSSTRIDYRTEAYVRNALRITLTHDAPIQTERITVTAGRTRTSERAVCAIDAEQTIGRIVAAARLGIIRDIATVRVLE